MSRPLFLTSAGAFFVAALAAAWLVVHSKNTDLKRLLGANAPALSFAASSASAPAATTDADRAEVNRLKAQVAQLEQEAEAGRARRLAAVKSRQHELEAAVSTFAAKGDANWDPSTGPARLERFQNVGANTPAAAFQTLIWAAVKGNDSQVADLLTLDSAAQFRADRILQGLDDDNRSQWTAQKLGVLWFEQHMLNQPALQISNVATDSEGNATVTINGLGTSQQIQMQHASGGQWQLVVPGSAMEGVQTQLGKAVAH